MERLCHDRSAEIKVMSTKAQEQNSDKIMHFVDISSEKATAEDITSMLQASTDIVETDLAKVGANRVIGSVISNDCVVCKALIETRANTFIGPASTEDDCKMNYKLFISGSGLPIFLQRLHNDGVAYKIEHLSPLSKEKSITTRQQKVLRSALELGYYDYPKRISTEQLAESLGIKPGTVAEILRRAEKNVIRRFFEADAD